MIPFLIFALFLNKSKKFSRFILEKSTYIKIIAGTILILTGILLYLGKLYVLTNILGGI